MEVAEDEEEQAGNESGGDDTIIMDYSQTTQAANLEEITENEELGDAGTLSNAVSQEKTVAFDIPAEMLIHIPADELDPDANIVGINDVTPQGNDQDTTNIPNGSVILRDGDDKENSEPHASKTEPVTKPTQEKVRPEMMSPLRVRNTNVPPKKGFNVKNRTRPETANGSCNAVAQIDDSTSQQRLNLLSNINDVVNRNIGQNLDEMGIWGRYVGIKLNRITDQKTRDDFIFFMEKNMNMAIQGTWALEDVMAIF